LAGGRRVPLDAVIVAPRMTARAELLAPLGLKPAEMRLGEHVAGTRIEADRTGATAAAGVWVAGNIADIQAQVITSAAAGRTARPQSTSPRSSAGAAHIPPSRSRRWRAARPVLCHRAEAGACRGPCSGYG